MCLCLLRVLLLKTVDEPRMSKKCRVETSFDHDFLIIFFIEDFYFLTDLLVFAFFIEEDSKIYGEDGRSIDLNF